MKVIKRELCRSRHQEMVQVDESPEGAQQLCSPVQLGQGGDHISGPQLLPPDQQARRGDDVRVQLQRQTAGGHMAPNMGPQQTDQGWEAPEVTVQVRPQKLSQGWESPEVTVQVQPQKPTPRWEALSVTVQVQLQQQGRGPALPQVTVQVQPQERGQGMAGIKVAVKLQLSCDTEEVTCLQEQGEEVLGNEEQLTPKQNEGEPTARSEGEGELAVVELVPQGALSQKQNQEGQVTKPQQDQSQEKERAEVVDLQEIQVGDKADLDGMATEEQLQDQSQEQEQLKADLPPQKEGQRATEMRQEQVDVQEGPKGMVEDQKEDLGQEVSKKRPRETPNYFVAIPITDDQVF
ncbi:uncharacterized protein LOC142600266 [Balearica regulorum gibbericeps]|uniref:uncharacterized protein LOC142600266 n=1 Tax=Balearica regulorum gibbericeps TaxID=100784 RepID=UPI003F62BBB0